MARSERAREWYACANWLMILPVSSVSLPFSRSLALADSWPAASPLLGALQSTRADRNRADRNRNSDRNRTHSIAALGFLFGKLACQLLSTLQRACVCERVSE